MSFAKKLITRIEYLALIRKNSEFVKDFSVKLSEVHNKLLSAC